MHKLAARRYYLKNPENTLRQRNAILESLFNKPFLEAENAPFSREKEIEIEELSLTESILFHWDELDDLVAKFRVLHERSMRPIV